MDKPTNNVNKYTAPTPEKAQQEVDSRIANQKKRGGWEEKIPKRVPDMPMLAQKWEDHAEKTMLGKRDRFEKVAVQPKLDGLRCIADYNSTQTRRNLKIRSVPHITNILSYLPQDARLDGELYIHGVDLQTLQSYVARNLPHPCSIEVQYHVFDIINLDLPFVERHKLLAKAIQYLTEEHKKAWEDFKTIPPQLRGKAQMSELCPVRLVPTHFIDQPCEDPETRAEIKSLFTTYRNQGYEGVMVRDQNSHYEMNYRSPHLLKYKIREDAEFEVIDISEGYDKTGIFMCKTEKGKVFEATPAWPLFRKKMLLTNKDKFIGRMVTVEYEKLSQDGIPLKPVAKCTREVA